MVVHYIELPLSRRDIREICYKCATRGSLPTSTLTLEQVDVKRMAEFTNLPIDIVQQAFAPRNPDEWRVKIDTAEELCQIQKIYRKICDSPQMKEVALFKWRQLTAKALERATAGIHIERIVSLAPPKTPEYYAAVRKLASFFRK